MSHFRHDHLARLADTLALLLTAGLPLTDIIGLLAGTTGNTAVRAALAEAGAVFPPLLVSMVQVGEEAGNLPEQLGLLARLYAAEADARFSRVIGLITPLLTVVVGGIVLFVAVAMLGAIYAVTAIVGP